MYICNTYSLNNDKLLFHFGLDFHDDNIKITTLSKNQNNILNYNFIKNFQKVNIRFFFIIPKSVECSGTVLKARVRDPRDKLTLKGTLLLYIHGLPLRVKVPKIKNCIAKLRSETNLLTLEMLKLVKNNEGV